MPDGKGDTIQLTGKVYALNMATVGIWDNRGTMDDDFLLSDNTTFYQRIGLA
jgi:hypothetical protein